MKTQKGNVKIKVKPVRVLYYSNYQVILRAEDDNAGQKDRFDKKALSEVDLDRIFAIA